MNIGEISKPSVERTQVKKSLKPRSTDAIAPSRAVSDQVELSEESRQKYNADSNNQQKKRKDMPNKPKSRRHLSIELTNDKESNDQSKPSIDYKV